MRTVSYTTNVNIIFPPFLRPVSHHSVPQTGCLLKVEINRRTQDLNSIEKQNKVVPGCDPSQQHDEAKSPPVTNKIKSFLQEISQPAPEGGWCVTLKET